MMKKHFIFLATVIIVGIQTHVNACTSAVISGKCTVDGRPLLWKNRDTGTEQNALMYFNEGKHEFLGLINANENGPHEIWAGYNSAGFAIMNTASYNLIEKDTVELKDREGVIMKLALMHCATLADFEVLLDTMQKPMGIEANFGVIDAEGGAAYYEADNFNYKKIDVNNPAVAPFGYVVHSNYSYTGSPDGGYGYIRYQAAENLIYQAVGEDRLSVRFIQQNMSRSLKHALTGDNLKEKGTKTPHEPRYVFFEDYIPRFTSSASVVVQGVRPGEDVRLTTMWTILGFPLASVVTPVWLAGGDNLPGILTLNNKGVAPLSNAAVNMKYQIFPIQRGSGKRYMDINKVYNKKGTGVVQVVRPFEDAIFDRANAELDKWRNQGASVNKVQDFYDWMETFVKQNYIQKLGVDLAQ